MAGCNREKRASPRGASRRDGVPTLRLKGPYFALAMLSGAVIMQRLMLIFWEQTGGEEGINGIEPLIRSQLGFYCFALAVLALVTALPLLDEPSVGTAILIAHQDAQSALRIADRVHVLEHGRVGREGASAELAADDYIRQAYFGVA